MTETPPEFSYVIELDALPAIGETFTLRANASERGAVARRLGVRSVEQLEGKLRVKATRDRIEASGEIAARLGRQCVASLEDMTEVVEETFDIEFSRIPEAAPTLPDDENWLDQPEIHEDPSLDLGELLVQQTALAMAAFPRKEGAKSLAEDFSVERERSGLASALAKAMKQKENQ